MVSLVEDEEMFCVLKSSVRSSHKAICLHVYKTKTSYLFSFRVKQQNMGHGGRGGEGEGEGVRGEG